MNRTLKTEQLIPEWQIALSHSVKDLNTLLSQLGLKLDDLPNALRSSDFPLKVPQSYIKRMQKGMPNDPLLRQVLPLNSEQTTSLHYSKDPVGDLKAMPIPGLLHKYHGRALLITTGACAIHCRYCFRQHFPYAAAKTPAYEWSDAIQYIASDDSITEVILSGGDPLALSTDRLTRLTDKLSAIAHVKRLRIHTRLPVVLPERIDEDICQWLNQLAIKPIMVIHSNHPNEIDDSVISALNKLHQTGTTLLNQSVLLEGVNNNAKTLVELSERLFSANVMPYYLHQLDRVSGAAHFEVSDSEATNLLTQIRAQLPGYLVPKLVREEAGESSKTPLSF